MISHSFTPHPLTAVKYLKRLLPLLIIPVATSLYRYILYGVSFSASPWDVMGALLSILWARLEYKSISVRVKDGRIFISKGFVFNSEWNIRLERITAIYTRRTLICLIFGAVKVSIETQAGSEKEIDFEFYVNQSDAKSLVNCLADFKADSPIKSSIWQSLLLALSETSAWSGLLLFATAINYLGRFLGRQMGAEVFNKLTDRVKKVGVIIPPVTATLAGLILLGFVLSFVVAVVHHLSHSVELSGKTICIRQGVLLRSHAYIFVENIPCAFAVGSPVLYFFSRKNLRILVGGYQNKQDGESVLPAVENDTDFFDCQGNCITCHKDAKGRVVKIPLILTGLCLVGLAVFIYNMPDLAYLWAIVFLSIAIVCLYRLKVKLHGIKKGFAAIGNKVRISHPKRLTHLDSITPLDFVDGFELRQTPFDLRYKVCTLTVKIFCKKKSRFSAANLELKKAISFLKGECKTEPF